MPRELPLELVQRNVEGVVSHEQRAQGDAVVHKFQALDQPRELDKPHTPPRAWWLPWIEFGMDADVPRSLAQMSIGMREPTAVTPEIRAAAEKVVAGVSGDTATARALHDFVNHTLDKRGWGTATQALLSREGSATYLYAALLTASGVPHELVWSHDVSPDSDTEPDPPFVEPNFYGRKLLVLVQPRDGEPAWCDMDDKTLPYGHLIGRRAGRALGDGAVVRELSRCRTRRSPTGRAWTSTWSFAWPPTARRSSRAGGPGVRVWAPDQGSDPRDPDRAAQAGIPTQTAARSCPAST